MRKKQIYDEIFNKTKKTKNFAKLKLLMRGNDLEPMAKTGITSDSNGEPI